MKKVIPLVHYSDRGSRYVIGEGEVSDTHTGEIHFHGVIKDPTMIGILALHSDADKYAVDMEELHISFGYVRAPYFLRLSKSNGEVMRFMKPKQRHRLLSPQQLEELDRNARAYGFEIGRGQRTDSDQIDSSPDNPFLDPDWRNR